MFIYDTCVECILTAPQDADADPAVKVPALTEALRL